MTTISKIRLRAGPAIRLTAFAVVGLVSALGMAWAAESSPPPINLTIPDTTIDDAQEAKDQRAVEAALSDFQARGFPGLTAHIDGLKEIMARAPATYPKVEKRRSVVIVHTEDLGEYLIYSTLVVTALQKAGEPAATVEMRPNVYPQVTLLLGAYANEVRNHEEAGQWLDRGLAMQPHNWMLCLEKAASLMARRRPAEAVAILTDALDNAGLFLATEHRARLLRNRGVSLIDVGRLDDAEKDLKESIRLLPNNPAARNELEYIAKLRAGGRAAPVELVTPQQQREQEQQSPPQGEQQQ